ncbi:MAG: biotin--[acetyl-CoA-carboxylase] ligase [Bacteroidales bacterium]|nr:biotin--[acetyl-CoA-carboxylase] ligase [Bacteroidales bacterium]
MDIIWYEELQSTLDAAAERASQLKDRSIIASGLQTRGRGQGGNKWLSAPWENLLFSLLLKDFKLFGLSPLPAEKQFLLSRAAALSVVHYLEGFGLKASIKWPNDIYVGDRKICGILIENALRGDRMGRCIIGIGINLGQKAFSPDLPNPTSVALLTGRRFDRSALESELIRWSECFENLLPLSEASLTEKYETLLYRKGVPAPYRDSRSGEEFSGILLGTRPDGTLRLRDEKGFERNYRFKEVEFIV